MLGKATPVHHENAMRSINGKKAYVQKLLNMQKAKQTDNTDNTDKSDKK